MTPHRSTALNASVRIGGMAFGNGVLMRGPHYWAWATDDGKVAYAPVRSLLRHRGVKRIPVLRSLVGLGEMLFLMVSLYRRNGWRRSLRLIAFLAAALACDMGLGLLVPYVAPDLLATDLILTVMVFALGIGAMRLGLGSAVWRYHGAEHKAVNAYEGGADLEDVETVARYSRVHDRCGTNLVVIAVVLTLATYVLVDNLPFALGAVCSVLIIGVSLELFRLIVRRPASKAVRVFLAGGRALQRAVTTAEPGPEHLERACTALRCVLELEAGWVVAGPPRVS